MGNQHRRLLRVAERRVCLHALPTKHLQRLTPRLPVTRESARRAELGPQWDGSPRERIGANCTEEPRRSWVLEQSLPTHNMNAAADRSADRCRIQRGHVIRGQDHRPCAGHVFGPFELQGEEPAGNPAAHTSSDGDVDHHLQPSPLSTARDDGSYTATSAVARKKIHISPNFQELSGSPTFFTADSMRWSTPSVSRAVESIRMASGAG